MTVDQAPESNSPKALKAIAVAHYDSDEPGLPVKVVAKEVSEEDLEAPRSFLGKIVWTIASGLEWLFGAATLTIGLAVLAVIPVLQFLSLGYLFEACGRVSRTGRLRDGFIGVRKAAKVGSVIAGMWLVVLPLRVFSSLFVSSRLIDPSSRPTQVLGVSLTVMSLLAFVHIALACANGGRLRNFLWPFSNPFQLYRKSNQGPLYPQLRDQLWDFCMGLRWPYYFWLGLRGFFGSLLWLIIPTALLAAGIKAPAIGLLGALMLAYVVTLLPFLQAHFATEDRFSAFFDVSHVREQFRHAPLAFTAALYCTLLFPIPLYLFKIEVVPSEAGWMPSLFFVAFIFPARLLTGWAYGRAQRQEQRRHWFWRLISKPSFIPVAGFYVFMVFASQYTSWEGIAGLFGQHAFLLPVPFAEFPNF